MGQVIEADETTGTKRLVEPEPTEDQRRQAYEAWVKEWDALSEEIGKVWPAGLSAVDAVAEQRR